MAKRATRDLTVGVMAALALAIVAMAVMAVGEESRLFTDRATYRVQFPNTVGLVVGSPVLIAGVQVGTVSEIRLPTDPGEAGIQVRVGVERKYAVRVRTDSQAALRILQLLSGEKYVEITPGSPELDLMPEDALIPPVEETALLEQGEDIAENLNEITLSLKGILGPLERGEGILGELIQNPEFGRQGLDRLTETVDNLEALTEQIRAGRGFVGRVLYDEGFAAKVDDLSRSVESFAGVAACLGPEEGSLCDLLAKEGTLQRALESLEETAASLRRTTAKLESEQGLLGRLLNDEAYSEQLAQDLSSTTRNLAEITDKINRGEGTIGALVNERTVHDGMEEVIAGVNDSKFARWLLRHYQKKGIEAEETAEE